MATRPVFVHDIEPDHGQLVHEHQVDFQWVSASSAGQKKENIAKLHAAARHRNLFPLLEVTQESDHPLGAHVSPSNLAVEDERSYLVPLNAPYHGSKMFTGGGPFTDLYLKDEQEIVGDLRLVESGILGGYRFAGLEWGIKSGTMFYDWLALQAIHRNPKLRRGIRRFKGFTDIACRFGDDAVCHARSCALYVALVEKELIDKVITDQNLYIETLVQDSFYQP